MASSVVMPKTGMAMEEGTIVRWLKAVGDPVARGETIAVIETDKVTMDLESDYEGTLLSIVHHDGEVVKATDTIAWIGAAGEKVQAAALQAAVPARQPEAPPVVRSYAEASSQAMTAASAVPAKARATPAARVFAARAGMALSRVGAGTAPAERFACAMCRRRRLCRLPCPSSRRTGWCRSTACVAPLRRR